MTSAMFALLGAALAQDLVVDGTTTTLSGAQTYDTVTVVNGGVLRIKRYDGTPGTGFLGIAARRVVIDETSIVDGVGRGYQGVREDDGEGPGRGISGLKSGSGGGHGGAGGAGTDDACAAETAGGTPHGQLDTFAEMGSAGGAPAGSGTAGGAGGAALVIDAEIVDIRGAILLDGDDGQVGTDEGSGGGAGGGLTLIASTLYCTGLVSVSGGDGGAGSRGSGGGGAGGRVEQYHEGGLAACTVVARPGRSGCTLDAGPGTDDESVRDYDGDGQRARDGDCAPADPAVFQGAPEGCDGLDNDCDNQIDDGGICSGCTRASRGNRGYQFCTTPRTFFQADGQCATMGYELVDIVDAAENSWLDGQLDGLSTSEWWTGYTDRDLEGTWTWTSGLPRGYENWRSGQPNGGQGGNPDQDCMVLNAVGSGQWVDQECTGSYRTACETCVARNWYQDADGDGFGGRITALETCDPPQGWIADGTDCDDTRAGSRPGATEQCNGRDDDCDGVVDESCPCGISNFDGHRYLTCDRPATWPGAVAWCESNGMSLATIDDSAENAFLDATVDQVSLEEWWFGYHDRVVEGSFEWTAGGTDYVNWRVGQPNGGQQGVPDQDCTVLNGNDLGQWFDQECSLAHRFVCEQLDTCLVRDWYEDGDGDGYGDDTLVVSSCNPPTGHVPDGGDCDDTDPDRNPGAADFCDNVDNNCDGRTDPACTGCAQMVGTGTNYLLCNGSDLAWTAARDFCADQGMWLVTMNGNIENNAVANAALALDSSAPWWIGYTDRSDEGFWEWDGPDTGYTNWQAGQPNGGQGGTPDQDCAQFGGPGGLQWVDQECGGSANFVCETFDCVPLPRYADDDRDGFGDPNDVVYSCLPVGNRVDNPNDCNDAFADRNPNAPEQVGDGIDQDCDGVDDCYDDDDRDGFGDDVRTGVSLACNSGVESKRGGDCKDTDAQIYPGAPEQVGDGVDQDCDGVDDCYRDNDRDTWGGGTVITGLTLTCTGARESDRTGDCNDNDTNVNPGEAEIPGDTIDQDCDGVDDCYRDNDRDGFGTTVITGTTPDCSGSRESDVGGDCDDADPDAWPGAPELPGDHVDQDCDTFDDCYRDGDRDTWGTSTVVQGTTPDCSGPREASRKGDCNDGDADIFPGAPETPGDDVDQDCDTFDDCFRDTDSDTWGDNTVVDGVTLDCSGPREASRKGDCDNDDPDVYPGAPEDVADGVDQDCDGGDTCYLDSDDDGYGLNNTTIDSADLDCDNAPGEASRPGDCNDGNRNVNPDAPEIPVDGLDQNCSGGDLCYVDLDGDEYGGGDTAEGDDLNCRNGPLEANQLGDCGDDDPDIHPGAPEICGDGVDNDCDGNGGPATDDDLDGLPWLVEQPLGADDCDDDSDDDLLTDTYEHPLGDYDNDGDWNLIDPDDDNDTIPTRVEGNGNAEDDLGCDNPDALPNYLDDDSDGDGLTDLEEGWEGDGDDDGIPDFLDCNDAGCYEDADGDGLGNCDEVDVGTNPASPDSDLDTVGDLVEVGGDATDPRRIDTDGDQTIDPLDEDDDNDSVLTRDEDSDRSGTPTDDDTDGDQTLDYLDEDDDDDGILTIDEDADGDGDPRDDDTDGDGRPDYLDADDFDGPGLDIDDDGLTNQEERNLGTLEWNPDTDGDGRIDGEEVGPDPFRPFDDDDDGAPDALDPDDDGDGWDSAVEGWTDADGDDLPNALDQDSDDDVLPDRQEDLSDADCDQVPALLDADDDDGPCGPGGRRGGLEFLTNPPGCGCGSAPNGSGSSGAAWLAAVALGAGVARRRRAR